MGKDQQITNLTHDEHCAARAAASLAVAYWPNAHLGDYSPREDLRSAFKMIRQRMMRGQSFAAAIAALEDNALSHADM